MHLTSYWPGGKEEANKPISDLALGVKMLLSYSCAFTHLGCVHDNSGVDYEPSFEECVLISSSHMHTSTQAWVITKDLSSLLLVGNGRHNETNIQPLPTARVPEQLNCSTLQCQEDFSCSVVGNTSVCLPVCGSWDEYPHETVVATDVVIVLSAVIGVVISIAMLLTSCIRWKNMLVLFPFG